MIDGVLAAVCIAACIVVDGMGGVRHSAITNYALALAPLSHVAALHETSVLFGALIGALFLNERFGVVRTAAAVVIVLGRVLMNGPTVFEPVRALSC